MSGPAASRHRARELALQVLYAIDVAQKSGRAGEGGAASTGLDSVDAFDSVAAHFESTLGARQFARDLVQGVRARAGELDSVIAEHARNWRIERMAVVDRNILRLAAFELACTETPTAVVLNEAVDLARRFGGDPSPAFVNGILDAVARSLRTNAKGHA